MILLITEVIHTIIQELAIKIMYMLSYNLWNDRKETFSDSEFLKDCTVETARIICPDDKGQFKTAQIFSTLLIPV